MHGFRRTPLSWAASSAGRLQLATWRELVRVVRFRWEADVMADESDYPDLEERNNQLNDPINDHVPVLESPDLGISRTVEDAATSAA